MKMLLVEDDPDVFGFLTISLRKWGYEVSHVTDANKAWEIVNSSDPPRLVVLDWQLPDGSGVEFCRKVRDRANQPYVYILMLSGRRESADIIEALDSGVDDYMVKPFIPAELKMRLKAGARVLGLEQELAHNLSQVSIFRQFVEAAAQGFCMMNPDGQLTYANPGFCELVGSTPTELLGKSFWSLHTFDKQSNVDTINQALSTKRVWRGESFLQPISGRRAIPVEENLFVMDRDPSQSRVYAAVVTNIAARRQMEADMRQTQKLESVGRLASGIAHELNTPVQFVSDSLHFLQESFADLMNTITFFDEMLYHLETGNLLPDQVAQAKKVKQEADLEYLAENVEPSFERIQNGLQRVASIVRAMKEFAHPGEEGKTLADINHIIETTLTVACNEYKYVADVDTDLAKLPQVECCVSEINQALLNIIVNAADAIRDSLGDREERGKISVRTYVQDNYIAIDIADTGAGISAENAERVFDLFFTTKDVGKGTGQGLALAHSTVVDKHGGRLWFDSESGRGTTFHLQLPLSSPQ